MEFPGGRKKNESNKNDFIYLVVPRTFLGPIFLAILAWPFSNISINHLIYLQYIGKIEMILIGREWIFFSSNSSGNINRLRFNTFI